MSPQARREQVAFVCERGLSKRRACGLIGISRSALNYVLRMPAKDAPLIEALQGLSSQYPRYGYRRMRIFLRRAGHELSWERTLAHGGSAAATAASAAPDRYWPAATASGSQRELRVGL